MKREDFDYFTSEYNNLHGVKKACFIVREYDRCQKDNNMNTSSISKEEYQKALNMVLAFAFNNAKNESKVEMWHCKGDCYRNNGFEGFCPGEFQLDQDTSNLCKWYSRK